MQEGFTLKQISAASGVQPRTCQFWTSERILLPKPSTHLRGPGTNRRYPKCEVQIAALLGGVKALGVQVGTLQVIAHYLRQTLLADQEFGFEDIEAARAVLDDDRRKPRFNNMIEQRRVIDWIRVQEAIHYKAKTVLALTIDEEGCTAAIFTFQPDTEEMKKAIDYLLKWPHILISIAPVLYEVECNLDPDFERYQ